MNCQFSSRYDRWRWSLNAVSASFYIPHTYLITLLLEESLSWTGNVISLRVPVSANQSP